MRLRSASLTSRRASSARLRSVMSRTTAHITRLPP